MRFLSEKVDHFIKQAQRQTAVLLCGVSFLGMINIKAQIDPGLTYENDAKKINTQLFERAKAKAADLTQLVRNDYSRQLENIVAEGNASLKRQKQPAETKVFAVDPAVWEVMHAFDNKGDAIANMVDKNAKVSETTLASANVGVGDNVFSIYGAPYYGNTPSAHGNIFSKNSGLRILIPASPYNMADKILDIPGMTYRQFLIFANRHEMQHCADPAIYVPNVAQDSMWIKQNYNQETPFLNESSRKFTHSLYTRENYADVSALGGMIVDGHPIDIIDAVTAWRIKNADDFVHMSAFSLQQLKKDITDMGLHTFKRMSPQKRDALYNKIVAENTLNVTEFSQLNDPIPPVSNSKMFTDFRTLIKQSIEANTLVSNIPIERAIKQFQIIDKLEGWNVKETLTDAAYAHTGMITPETITLAYGRLQDAFLKKAEAQPSKEHIYRESMAYLQSTFINQIENIDYAGENAKRCVPVTKLQTAFDISKYTRSPASANKQIKVKKPPTQPRL